MAKKKRINTKPKQIVQNKLNPESFYKEKIKRRFWMVLHYMSIPLASAFVFGFVSVCETLLFRVLWSLMENDIQQLPFLQTISDLFQVALTIVTFIGFLLHSAFSLYGQYQVEKIFLGNEE